MLFIIVGRPVVVFGGRTLVAVFERSPFGIKSKRIFLSADAASIPAFKAVIQPVGRYLKVVLLFSGRLRGSLSRPSEKRSTPKKSVSCASVRVVLVMSEPYMLFLLGYCIFFVFVVTEI